MVIINKCINYIINFNSDLAKRNIFNIIPVDIFTSNSNEIGILPFDKKPNEKNKIKCRKYRYSHRIREEKPIIKPLPSSERMRMCREKKKNRDNGLINYV